MGKKFNLTSEHCYLILQTFLQYREREREREGEREREREGSLTISSEYDWSL